MCPFGEGSGRNSGETAEAWRWLSAHGGGYLGRVRHGRSRHFRVWMAHNGDVMDATAMLCTADKRALAKGQQDSSSRGDEGVGETC